MTKKATNIIVIVSLILVIVIGLVVALVLSNNSSEHIMKSGNFEFGKKGDIVRVTKFNGDINVTEVEIPKEIDGYVVNTIGKDAFKDNTFITKVTMDTNITSIEDGAFSGCTSLATVEMKNVKTIGNEAFKGTTKLRNINMPASLESIGEKAFMDTSVLGTFTYDFNDDYTLNSALTTVGKDAFYHSALSTAIIPSGMKTIGERAFAYANIGTLVFYEGVETIDKEAFIYDDKANQSTNIYTFTGKPESETAKPNANNITKAATSNLFPKSLKVIGDGAFKKEGTNYTHAALNTLTFGENIESIGVEAFRGARWYEIDFKNPNTTLGAYSFSDMYGQGFIKLPANLKAIPDGLLFRASLRYGKAVDIPASVETIGTAAFSGSVMEYEISFVKDSPADKKYSFYKENGFQALMSKDGKILYSVLMGNKNVNYTVPGGVEVIDSYAFTNTGRNDSDAASLRMTIPSTVNTIRANAFSDCNVTSIYLMHGDDTPINIDAKAFEPITKANENKYTLRVANGLALENRLKEIKFVGKVDINTRNTAE